MTARPAAASTDTIFHSISACRIVNTTVSGGSFPDATTRHYYVGGTTGFTGQGGKAGGCGIPVGATAITATFTAVTPTGAGYLRAWANGSSEPNSTILTYPKAALSGATVGAGVYEVLTDTDVSSCTAEANPSFGTGWYASAVPVNGSNTVRVYAWNLVGGVVTPQNLYVYLHVIC